MIRFLLELIFEDFMLMEFEILTKLDLIEGKDVSFGLIFLIENELLSERLLFLEVGDAFLLTMLVLILLLLLESVSFSSIRPEFKDFGKHSKTSCDALLRS